MLGVPGKKNKIMISRITMYWFPSEKKYIVCSVDFLGSERIFYKTRRKWIAKTIFNIALKVAFVINLAIFVGNNIKKKKASHHSIAF
jgi:hypothetical protein